MKDLLGIIGILVISVEIYLWLRRKWIRHVLEGKKKGKMPRKPAVLRPKSELDCQHCVEGKGKKANPEPNKAVLAWNERKGRGGRRKSFSTEGYFCSNKGCEYYGIRDERIHALVGDGSHGKHEVIRDLKCQSCGKKFTIRKHTILYRLKTHSETVEKIVSLLAVGVDGSVLEEVFGVREITVRAWLCRSGMQGRKLHEWVMVELELIHVQLDELWGNVKKSGQELWLWTATDAKTKLLVVMQVGGRTQEKAYNVVHELKGRLKAGCVPVFSTDGLRHYYYALTAHFGKWEKEEGKKPVWVMISDFLYAQVIKHQRRRKTVEVERRMVVGEEGEYRKRLKGYGLSGKINTSFVERLNLTIRQNVSKLTRRTWGPAVYTSELVEHLEWWRVYYHFVRYHESLRVKLGEPIERKGKRQPQRYKKQTPAMAAGLTDRRWKVKELLLMPLP
jgi:IS1 family transposase